MTSAVSANSWSMASCGSLGSDKTRMVGFFIAQDNQTKFNGGVIVAALSHSLNLMVSSKGSSARSNWSSVRSLTFTLRKSAQRSTCSTVLPGSTLVIGPSVSTSRKSLLVKVSNEQPKSV